MSMKMSKAEIAAREEMEAKVVTNVTKPKALSILTSEERKVFNKLKKYNDQFTEADSINLNQIAIYHVRWTELHVASQMYDLFSAEKAEAEKRMLALDKQINKLMQDLAIPLSSRYKLANDLAKVMIEEKKLAQMEGPQMKEVNPLLAVLEATKNVK